ncbi:Avirulence (Avh) protein [Phytophthora megakarya]|uniref:RxLR effector protein n=1 Tax=Phytophthora megakarya TaxID=4795 RepID=A0A225V7A9_9STRA|nr:Avirulence (Avh) protein [Phytophthora megakarya]
MRLMFLATVVFVVSIGLNDADTPKVLRSDFSVIEYQPTNYISTTVSRLLRSSSAADKRLTEERAGIITVSVFEKIKSAFTSSKVTPKTLDSWLKNGKSSDAVFTRLHLDKRRFPIFEPQFGVWV